jgi:hypothetical protein
MVLQRVPDFKDKKKMGSTVFNGKPFLTTKYTKDTKEKSP